MNENSEELEKENEEETIESIESLPLGKKRERLYEKILNQLNDKDKIEVLKVAAESGLRKDDSALAKFYLMFYISVMYKEIPGVIEEFQQTLGKLGSDFEFYTTRAVGKNLKQMHFEYDSSINNSITLLRHEIDKMNVIKKEIDEMFQSRMTELDNATKAKIESVEKEYSRLKMSANEKFGEALKKTLPNILKPYLEEMSGRKHNLFRDLAVVVIGFSLVQIGIHIIQTFIH